MNRHLFSVVGVLSVFLSSMNASASSPCPDEEKPRMTVALKEQEHVLYLCGTLNTEDAPAKGFRSYSDVKIFAKQAPDPKKAKKKAKKTDPEAEPPPPPEPKLIFESSPLENYWIKKSEDTLVVDEAWPVVDKNVAVLSREVTCTPKACKLSKPKCVYKPKQKPFPDALKELRAALKDPAANPDADLKTLVGQTFAQALAGDQKARAFFMSAKKPESLIEEPSDEWHASKALLGRAKKSGCLR